MNEEKGTKRKIEQSNESNKEIKIGNLTDQLDRKLFDNHHFISHTLYSTEIASSMYMIGWQNNFDQEFKKFTENLIRTLLYIYKELYKQIVVYKIQDDSFVFNDTIAIKLLPVYNRIIEGKFICKVILEKRPEYYLEYKLQTPPETCLKDIWICSKNTYVVILRELFFRLITKKVI
jgi:hypothetical protein